MSEAAEDIEIQIEEPAEIVEDEIKLEDEPQEPTPKEEEPAEDPKPKETEDRWKDFDPGFSDEQQEFINEKVVGKSFARMKEAQRERDQANEKLQEAQQKLSQYETPQRPEVTPMPDDPFDDDYQAKMEAHYQSKAAQEQFDRDQQNAQQAAMQAHQEAQQREAEANVETAKTFFDRGDKVGHSQDQLEAAAGTLYQAGVHGEKGRFVLSHEQGPNIAMYLHKNIMEADRIGQMTDMQAAEYISTVVLPKAVGAAQEMAPEPSAPVVESPNGGTGIPESGPASRGWKVS